MQRPPHRSFFRDRLERRAGETRPGEDAVQEYLVGQANLRGFFGAYSVHDVRSSMDVDLDLEDIVVGLMMLHASWEPRILTLVLRILESGRIDLDALVLRARRERALPMLAWLIDLIPPEQRRAAVDELAEQIRANPPRERARPRVRYDTRRLVRKDWSPS